MRILLLNPPITDLHAPYSSIAYLTGFLRSRGYIVAQDDAGIEMVLRLYSREGLGRLRDALSANPRNLKIAQTRDFVERFEQFESTIDGAITTLQGRDPSLAFRVASGNYFPPSFRGSFVWSYEQSMALGELRQIMGKAVFDQARIDGMDLRDPLRLTFGRLGIQDRARYLATVFLEDIASVIRVAIDPEFELNRWGHMLCMDQPDFSPIRKKLEGRPTLIDEIADEVAREMVAKHDPDVVGITAAFPGSVYGAFRLARAIRKLRPAVKTILGGGYVNTHLRELAEPKVFEYFDFITLDDGERPLQCLLEHLDGRRGREKLFRTFALDDGQVVFFTDSKEHDIPHRLIGTPSYAGIDQRKYLGASDELCTLPRVWTHGWWNKLMLAHGCYWKKCSFCDIALDHVGRYNSAPAEVALDRMAQLTAETGSSGFHFVDEAMPPAILRELSNGIIKRRMTASWWGLVRFDRAFTPELAKLMAKAGCVAVEGGLEVVTDELLQKMQKGVSIAQVARVTRAFSEAGIFVHAFLIYGFPGQKLQDTIDALEYVRQLFKHGCIQSAVWSRFVVTPFSPVGANPEHFGVRILRKPARFGLYRMKHFDPSIDFDLELIGRGLEMAVQHYVHRSGFDEDVRSWFKGLDVPMPRVPEDAIQRLLSPDAEAIIATTGEIGIRLDNRAVTAGNATSSPGT